MSEKTHNRRNKRSLRIRFIYCMVAFFIYFIGVPEGYADTVPSEGEELDMVLHTIEDGRVSEMFNDYIVINDQFFKFFASTEFYKMDNHGGKTVISFKQVDLPCKADAVYAAFTVISKPADSENGDKVKVLKSLVIKPEQLSK